MEDYMIQVIIPVYNSAATLERCFESLKSQTFTRWAAIVVDDASTDGSADIIKRFAVEDGRFSLIQCEKNGGPARARNRALAVLDAEYAAFLDADDVWEPNTLEELYSAARKHGADVVQCGFVYDLPNGERLYPKGAFEKNTLICGGELRRVYMRMMTGINMNHVCMKLIRTSVISGLRFDVSMKTAEDLDFCIRMFRGVGVYYFTPERLYHYRRGGGSLTGGGLPFLQRLAANRAVSRTLAKTLPEVGMSGVIYRTLAYMRPYIIMCLKAGRIIREKIGNRKEKEGER